MAYIETKKQNEPPNEYPIKAAPSISDRGEDLYISVATMAIKKEISGIPQTWTLVTSIPRMRQSANEFRLNIFHGEARKLREGYIKTICDVVEEQTKYEAYMNSFNDKEEANIIQDEKKNSHQAILNSVDYEIFDSEAAGEIGDTLNNIRAPYQDEMDTQRSKNQYCIS